MDPDDYYTSSVYLAEAGRGVGSHPRSADIMCLFHDVCVAMKMLRSDDRTMRTVTLFW